MFGPNIENTKDYVALFYITLTVHDHLLHNRMLDSGASHNLMPKIIMFSLVDVSLNVGWLIQNFSNLNGLFFGVV
jgi:hypothetical protein